MQQAPKCEGVQKDSGVEESHETAWQEKGPREGKPRERAQRRLLLEAEATSPRDPKGGGKQESLTEDSMA